MIKIYISCRNRLGIFKKCIEALERHSSLPHQIYIFDNLTNYKIREHFEYAYNLYKNNLVSQYTFNTVDSTFNAFSKAIAINQFGQNHIQDPKWDKYDFLTILDSDIIVTPNWDKIVLNTWNDLKKLKLDKQIKIISQLPGGITNKKPLKDKVAGFDAKIGIRGGSGMWNVKPSFFQEVGFLDVKKLVGQNKKHDQLTWVLLEKINKGLPYILGLNHRLCIHCGKLAGSTCNVLTKYKNDRNKLDKIKFEEAEEKIDKLNFNQFMELIKNDKSLMNDW